MRRDFDSTVAGLGENLTVSEGMVGEQRAEMLRMDAALDRLCRRIFDMDKEGVLKSEIVGK